MNITTGELKAVVGVSWTQEVIRECLGQAAAVIEVDPSRLLEKTQVHKIAHARQGAIWLAHRRGVDNASLSRFFDMDWSTINYAIKAAQARHDGWAQTQRNG